MLNACFVATLLSHVTAARGPQPLTSAFMTVHQMSGLLIMAITVFMLLVFMSTHPFQ